MAFMYDSINYQLYNGERFPELYFFLRILYLLIKIDLGNVYTKCSPLRKDTLCASFEVKV